MEPEINSIGGRETRKWLITTLIRCIIIESHWRHLISIKSWFHPWHLQTFAAVSMKVKLRLYCFKRSRQPKRHWTDRKGPRHVSWDSPIFWRNPFQNFELFRSNLCPVDSVSVRTMMPIITQSTPVQWRDNSSMKFFSMQPLIGFKKCVELFLIFRGPCATIAGPGRKRRRFKSSEKIDSETKVRGMGDHYLGWS